MFDLESAIADWRAQMLAAGIKSPATLDELESHLREEMGRQLQSGLGEGTAFHSAVHQIGRPGLLTTEFKRAGGFLDWLGEDKTVRTNRVLALLWLVYCAGGVFLLGRNILTVFYFSFSTFRLTPDFLFAVLMECIYLRGAIASVLFFGGRSRERRLLWLIAILDAVGGIAAMSTLHFHVLTVAFTILGVVSIWLLRPTQKPRAITN
jgi:membrane protein implicated in regulation of membrane protease activity